MSAAEIALIAVAAVIVLPYALRGLAVLGLTLLLALYGGAMAISVAFRWIVRQVWR